MKIITQLAIALTSFVISFSTLAGVNPQQRSDINLEKSTVKWTGYHLAKSYEHWGNVNLKSGYLNVRGGEIESGTIVIDMKSISNGDLKDEAKNKKLVDHLKSDDFFHVRKFNTATLNIKGSSVEESGNSSTIADITIRGITKEISFGIMLLDETDNQYIYTAELMIDRSEHEVLYGWSIDNAMISGEFKLEVKIVIDK